MRKYDAITLDMGGTLVRFGCDAAVHIAPALPHSFLTSLSRHRAIAAQSGREVDLREVLREAGAANPEQAVTALIEREVSSMVVFPDTLKTLRTLRDRGYRLFLLSNVWSPSETYARALDRVGVWELLDGALFSHDVGWRKPHPELFRHLLEMTGTEAARTVHVGDKRTRDVKGAKESGLDAVYVDRGPRPDDRGDAPEPDYVVRSLTELLGLFP